MMGRDGSSSWMEGRSALRSVQRDSLSIEKLRGEFSS